MGMKVNAAVAASLLALPAVAAVSEPSGLSPRLRASVDEEAAFMLTGRGEQLFECKPRATDPNAYAWAFAAPSVTLYDGARSVGRLTSTNVWEATNDRTSISGTVRATQPGGDNNLPWALFRAMPSGDTGLFSGVTSVQRVNTSGGIAPATGCDATHTGTEVRAPFTADYYFYKRRGR
jgi:uncharacterized protein DUF3455